MGLKGLGPERKVHTVFSTTCTHAILGSDPSFGVNGNFGGVQLLKPPTRRAGKPSGPFLGWAGEEIK